MDDFDLSTYNVGNVTGLIGMRSVQLTIGQECLAKAKRKAGELKRTCNSLKGTAIRN